MKKSWKYAVIIALLVAGLLLLWWSQTANRAQVAKPSASPRPTLAVFASTPQVAAPTLAPVPAHSSAPALPPNNSGLQAPADLQDTIAEAIAQLQAKDIPGLMQTVIAPDMWDEWREEMLHNGTIQKAMPMMSEVYLRSMLTPDQLRQIMLQQGVPVNEKLIESYTHYSQPDRKQAQFLNDLQSILNQPPEMALDGVHALYHVNNGDGTSALFFQKVDGRWYLQN